MPWSRPLTSTGWLRVAYVSTEESARVPLIIAAPNQTRRGTVVEAPVGLIDLYPTLTELCGVKAPKTLQGQSLVPMLKDPDTLGRGWTLSQVTRNRPAQRGGRFFGYSLRTPRWRYTEWDSGKEGLELYDHNKDPQELTNLAKDPAHARIMTELSEQLKKAIGETFPASGKTPEMGTGNWAPNLTNP